MAQFNYTGRAANGELTSGLIEAIDAATAAKALAGRNVTPLNIYEATEQQSNKETKNEINFFTPKVSVEDLVIFARQMYSLSRSGIPILRAVNGLAETTNSKRMASALRDVVDQLERGRTFSSALHQHPHIFNQLFVSVVHVGENTGKLDEAFLQLSDYLVREQETRKQIKSATRYPIFVLIALVAALVVMNIWAGRRPSQDHRDGAVFCDGLKYCVFDPWICSIRFRDVFPAKSDTFRANLRCGDYHFRPAFCWGFPDSVSGPRGTD